MTEERDTTTGEDRGITSPDEPTQDATTPPDNPETEGGEPERAAERLDQAGGGH